MTKLTNLLKLLVVITLASFIVLAGIMLVNYWWNVPTSTLSVLAFVAAYFLILKPSVKYWVSFLVLLAEYKNIKERIHNQHKEILENLNAEMKEIHNKSEEERERIKNEHLAKINDILTKLREDFEKKQSK